MRGPIQKLVRIAFDADFLLGLMSDISRLKNFTLTKDEFISRHEMLYPEISDDRKRLKLTCGRGDVIIEMNLQEPRNEITIEGETP